MKAIIEFIKTTLLGGLLIVLPIWVSLLLILKALGAMSSLFKPLVHELPKQARHPVILSLLVLALGCFAIGLIIRTAVGRLVRSAIEQHLLDHIPGYRVLRGVTQQLADHDEAGQFAPCLAEIEEALVPAFIVEHHPDGRCTVFVPSAPTPAAGSIYILTPERVHPVDVSMIKAMSCVSKWGSGSGALLAAMQAPPTKPPAAASPEPEATHQA